MITIIFGVPRVGKTALLTKFALEFMHGVAARHDVRAANSFCKPLNSSGFHLVPPQDHLIFSDYYISDRHGSVSSYDVNGFYLGLPNDRQSNLFIPPYSRIYLDEAQKYYNSRRSTSFPDFVSRFYEIHGHYHLNITMAVQRPGLIDLNIRELACQIIEVQELHLKYDWNNRLIRADWNCNVYDNVSSAIAYVDGGHNSKLLGDKVTYSFVGNIFKHYNSYNFMPAHLRDRYEQNFDLAASVECKKSMESIKEFNLTHDISVPDTFYKGGKK